MKFCGKWIVFFELVKVLNGFRVWLHEWILMWACGTLPVVGHGLAAGCDEEFDRCVDAV